jgi:hypothetical protein
MSNLCEAGAVMQTGGQLDGTFRFHARGQNIKRHCSAAV